VVDELPNGPHHSETTHPAGGNLLLKRSIRKAHKTCRNCCCF